MTKTTKYGHWIIFKERGIFTGKTFWSALQKEAYEAAQRGEFRIPHREASKRELIKLLDKIDAERRNDDTSRRN